MRFYFDVIVRLDLEHKPGESSSVHNSCSVALLGSKELDMRRYLDDEGLPTAEGSKVVSTVLLSGIAANIHTSHQKGFRDSAEHLRWIISELERQFVQIADISKGKI